MDKAIEFIRQEESKVQNRFKDWNIEKLADVLTEFANRHHTEQLRLHDVSNCPNLTNLWNEAVFKQERNEHSIFDTNDCWGALRTLEKHGLCKINNY